MQFTYNQYGKLKQSKLVLANPQKNKIGLLSGAKNMKFKPYFNSISELNYRVYKELDGVQNKYYDKLVNGRLIEMRYSSWFQIKKVEEKYDEDSQIPYKNITCLSLENELIYKSIWNVSGVYALYNNSDTSKSLLHIVANSCQWSIGYVSNSLIGLYRMFEISSSKIYNFLNMDVAKSFNCVFQYNTYDRTINCYALSELGDLTNITISDKNILKSYVKESDLDRVVTKMRVTGGVGEDGILLDIRSVNFGSDYIINIDYYLTTDWMSLSLINAYTAYKTKIASYQTSYSSTINQLKAYQSELTTLTNELKSLMAQQNAYEIAYKSYVDADGSVPSPSDIDYTLYQTALSNYNSMFPLIASKNTELSNKETQITSVQNTLNNISNELDMNSNFTQSQLDELESFLYEGEEYNDSSFSVTSTMTETEVINLKLQLLANATAELTRASRPQYTFSTSLSNLFTLVSGDDKKISFDTWKSQFQVGNIITLKFRDNYKVQVRLMSMEFDFDNQTDIVCTFSDKSRLDDELIQLAEILAQSNRTSTAVSLSKYGWSKASDVMSDARSFMNGTLTATNNKMASNDNQELLIDVFGLHMRKFLPDQSKYSDYQSWWNNYNLLFTSNNWQSSSTAIGLLTAPDGEQYFGIATDVLVGNLIMGEKLVITNSSGNYTWNDSGMIASATLSGNTYSVGINPSTPSSIFNIKVNDINKFYVDTVTQSLVFDGKITSTSGNIGGWNIGANSLTSSDGAMIHILRGSNESMILDDNGLSLYNPNVSNSHFGDISSIYTNGVGGMIISQGLNANLFAIGHNTSGSLYELDMVFTNNGFSASGIGNYSSGFHFNRSINVNASLTIGGYSVATQNWVQNNYASSSGLSSLEDRVSALESA
jgi:hypothetical protein